jgi:glycosyltransferase involved in cell wall biosynthesis
MRIVHLTPELPHALGGSGGSTRQFHLLRRLAEHSHDVTVVAPLHASQEAGAAQLAANGLRLVAIRRPSSRVREALGAVARRPELLAAAAREPVMAWQVDVFWTALRRLAARELAAVRPDVITVEHDWAAAWHTALPAGVPRALTLQNLSWSYYEARARSSGGLARVALHAEAGRFRRFDATHLDAYDLLIAMSELDRAGAAAVTRTRCVAIPNGVDLRDWPAAPQPAASASPLVLFTGTLSYPPNAEGLEWLLREIWPRIRARLPATRLRVIGRGAPASAERLASPEVEFTGWVPDMRPHFAAADLIVVPILSGGGTRLKVLDGLAAARAIVSTPAGAEGIDVIDAEHLALAADAGTFAQAAAELLTDPVRRAALGAAGRALVEERYDWTALGDRLEAELARLASLSP